MTFSLIDKEHGSVGADIVSGLTVALALVGVAAGDGGTETDTGRQRRLRQAREVAKAASDSRGGGGGCRWIGSESADGGSASGGDGRWKKVDRDRHRPTQTAASDSRGGDGCVRLERQRRRLSTDRIRVGRRWQWLWW